MDREEKVVAQVVRRDRAALWEVLQPEPPVGRRGVAGDLVDDAELRERDVRLFVGCALVEVLKHVRGEEVVRVQERQVSPGSQVEADVAGRTRAAHPRPLDVMHAVVAGREFLDDAARVVRGAVVDDEDLDVGQCLAHDTAETPA